MTQIQVNFTNGDYVIQNYDIVPRQNDYINVFSEKDEQLNGIYLVDRVLLSPITRPDPDDTIGVEIFVSRLV